MLHNPEFTGEEIGVFESQFVTPIPYSKHSINEADIDAVLGCLKHGPITQGNIVTKFEKAISNKVQSYSALVSNSATSSLHLCCLALGVSKGDIVWTSPITFVSTANVVVMCGAKINFVDIDPSTGNICPIALKKKLEKAHNQKELPKALIVVHLTGRPCKMKEIYEICCFYDIKIIEDASHALGSSQEGKPTGKCDYSDMTVFSLHPAKIITSGEGGIITGKNKELMDKVRLLNSHGLKRSSSKKDPWEYDMIELGYNYRMSDIHASLGLSQLKRLENFIERRKFLVKTYNNYLEETEISTPDYSESSSWHLYICQVDNENTRRDLYNFLNYSGVSAAIHYRPVYKNTYFKKMGFSEKDYPNCESFYKKCISLPLYFELSEGALNFVISKIKEFYGARNV